jgi:hypothetical protein
VDDPQRPTGWQRLGAADTLRYTAMVLCFRCSLFLRNRWSARNSPRGSSISGRLQNRTCGSKVQASNFGDSRGMLQGSAHDEVGLNGCGMECRTPVSGRWSSRSVARGVAMKGANLGLVWVFFEIPVQLPSIYRGFGLIISCACRTLSPSFPIRLGFDISTGFVDSSVGGVFVSVATRRGVGEDRCCTAPGPCASEAGAG